MNLQSYKFNTPPMSGEPLEDVLQSVHRKIRKGGWVHCDEEPKLQSIYWPSLYSLSSLEVNYVLVSSFGKVTIADLSAGVLLVRQVGEKSLCPVFLEFSLGEGNWAKLAWNRGERGMEGLGINLACHSKSLQEKRDFFQQLITRTGLRELVRMVDFPPGYYIEPLSDGLEMHYSESTHRNGRDQVDPISWTVLGIESDVKLAEIFSQVIEYCHGSSQPEAFSARMNVREFEEMREQIGQLSDGWEIEYSGQMKEKSILFLMEQEEYLGRIPLMTWLEQSKRAQGARRLQIDLAQIAGDGCLEVNAFAETRKEAVALLQDKLPKSITKLLPLM